MSRISSSDGPGGISGLFSDLSTISTILPFEFFTIVFFSSSLLAAVMQCHAKDLQRFDRASCSVLEFFPTSNLSLSWLYKSIRSYLLLVMVFKRSVRSSVRSRKKMPLFWRVEFKAESEKIRCVASASTFNFLLRSPSCYLCCLAHLLVSQLSYCLWLTLAGTDLAHLASLEWMLTVDLVLMLAHLASSELTVYLVLGDLRLVRIDFWGFWVGHSASRWTSTFLILFGQS